MGAHNFYVPAQLFETAEGYLALFVTHDEFWRRLCVEIGRAGVGDAIDRFATMHARYENRAELLAALTARSCRQATAAEWTARLRPLGLPVGRGRRPRRRHWTASSSGPGTWWCRSATDDGPLHMLGNPIRFDGGRGEYRPPPRLHEHTAEVFTSAGDSTSRRETADGAAFRWRRAFSPGPAEPPR